MAYQLILLGPLAIVRAADLEAAFNARVVDIGLTPGVDTHVLITPNDSDIDWKGAPVAMWLGQPGKASSNSELELLDKLLAMPAPVFPVVEDRGQYHAAVPNSLYPINGAQWLTKSDLAPLVADVFRAMRLTRVQHRAFISYRRDKTLGVARQLFTELGLRGYHPPQRIPSRAR